MGLKPGGRCLGNPYPVNMLFSHSAMLVVADFVLGIVMPIVLLKDLKMRTSLKIMSGALLSLGAIASVATIVRLWYMHTLGAKDFLYAASPLILWANFELAWCIVGISLATLKPLAVRLGLIKDSPVQASYQSGNLRSFFRSAFAPASQVAATEKTDPEAADGSGTAHDIDIVTGVAKTESKTRSEADSISQEPRERV